MSNFEASRSKQQTLRNETRSLSDQVKELKTGQDNIIKVINSQLGPLPRKVDLMEEVVDAVMVLSGFTKTEVENQIKAKRSDIARAEGESAKAALAEGVTNGYLTLIPTITEKTIVVATESDPSGKLVDKDGEGRFIHEGRIEVLFESLSPDMKTLLNGKSVNEVVDLPSGGKLTLNEVYSFDEEKMRAHFTESMAKVTADTAALETPVPATDAVTSTDSTEVTVS